MQKMIVAALALSVAAPALAQAEPVQGPLINGPNSAAAAAPVDPAVAENLRLRRSANRWEVAYLSLSAIDLVQTCDALHRGVAVEKNPLFGEKPSCAKLTAAKLLMGGVHFLLFDAMRDRSPKVARLAAQMAIGIQGTAVALNMRYTFKGR